jgi:hypothetical protein
MLLPLDIEILTTVPPITLLVTWKSLRFLPWLIWHQQLSNKKIVTELNPAIYIYIYIHISLLLRSLLLLPIENQIILLIIIIHNYVPIYFCLYTFPKVKLNRFYTFQTVWSLFSVRRYYFQHNLSGLIHAPCFPKLSGYSLCFGEKILMRGSHHLLYCIHHCLLI